MGSIRVALAQINTTVGDLNGNFNLISTWLDRARAQHADLVLFPELTITGYPPEDLLLHPQFITDNLEFIDRVANLTHNITAVVGFADRVDGKIYNAAAVFSDGAKREIYHKNLLPNYAVFDEKRYFASGERFPVLVDSDIRIGLTICEDIWEPGLPTEVLAKAGGAALILNISASPYHVGKVHAREEMMCERASANGVYLAFCNLVGGQDELIFSGRSAVFSPEGKVIARAKAFEEDLMVVDLDIGQQMAQPTLKIQEFETSQVPIELGRSSEISDDSDDAALLRVEETHSDEEAIYKALTLGTRDYVHKNQMQSVLIGISGGIDSALVAAIAVDALGPEHVKGVFMPSQYTAAESFEGVQQLAESLGIELVVLPIDKIFNSALDVLEPVIAGSEWGVAEENLQSRIRGQLLMALSNKAGGLVLTTGNKSEYALGYATLYGDMVGGLAVIKDLSKKRVYEVANWRNSQSVVIPQITIDRAPSAELRPNQRDEDDLPLPYAKLDQILEAYIEHDLGPGEMEISDEDRKLAFSIMKAVDLNEYKRRQSAPGLRITPKAFGKDRRYPITNRYHFQGEQDERD